MFRDNLRLVPYICWKFSEPRDASVDRDDMLQTGYEGLWIACLKFDESKGFTFSTYATQVIKGYVLRMLRDTETLKVPREYKDIRSALNRHGFTVPLTDEEIDILVSEGKFSRKQIMDYAEPIVMSLDFNLDEDSDSTLGNVIPDPDANIEYQFTDEEIERIIESVLKYIKPSYRDLVEEWMYATLAGVPLRQRELSVKYKKSQCHVARILKYAVYILQMHGDEIRNLFGY